jgi:hypothetical protein
MCVLPDCRDFHGWMPENLVPYLGLKRPLPVAAPAAKFFSSDYSATTISSFSDNETNGSALQKAQSLLESNAED